MAGGLTAAMEIAPNTSTAQQHILGLDTVRAFAALSVVLAHILGPNLPGILQHLGVNQDIADLSKYIFTGHPAVIVFFLVSGFCIHYPYTHRTLPVIAFTMTRWARIMPPTMSAMSLAYLLHVEKYNFVDGFILWSIVCELWYYSLYPFFLWLSRSVSFEKQFLFSFLISLMVVSLLGSNQYGSAHIYGPGLNWLVALPSWLLGCVLANHLSNQVSPRAFGKRSIMMWRSSVATIAAVLYYLTMNTIVGYYLTMNLFAILVFFWIRVEIGSPHNLNSLFERIGKWSFSIYLFHMIFLALLNKFGLVPLGINSGASIVVVLCMCYLAYLIVERASHNYARRLFKAYRVRFSQLTVTHG